MDVWAHIWNQFFNSCSFFLREVKFHMTSYFLKLCKQNIVRSPQYVMYFVNLIKFIVAGEERKQRKYFEKDTAHAPVVHLMVIVAICEQAFWWTIPPG